MHAEVEENELSSINIKSRKLDKKWKFQTLVLKEHQIEMIYGAW